MRSRFRKSAALGGTGSDAPFEELFSQLAHSYLQDKAPSLLPYEQGFQVLERNEDDTKALGVTGFKINGMQIFSPVFCINGEIKGHELLRLDDQNIWVPLKEAWLNEIFRRKPITIGDSMSRDTSGISAPDLSMLSVIPAKTAGYYSWNSTLRNIARLAKPSIADIACDLYQAINPMNHIKTASCAGLQKLNDMLAAFPFIKSAFEQVHPGGTYAVQRELQRRHIQMKSAANGLKPVKRSKKYANAVRFISCSLSLDAVPLGLNDEEKEKLMHNGYLVQDDRRDDEITQVVSGADRLNTLENPTVNGIYDVMVKPGKIRKLAVLRAGTSNWTQRYIVDMDTHAYTSTAPREVWVTHKYPDADYIKWVNSLPTDWPQNFKDVIVLRGAFDAFGPYNGGEYYGVCCSPASRDEPIMRAPDINAFQRAPKGSAFMRNSGTLQVPEDAHILKLEKYDESLVEPVNTLDYLSRSATVAQIKEAALANLEPLKIVARSGECILNGAPAVSMMDGFERLITHYGLREKDAKLLMKQAEVQHTRKVWLKRADLETPTIPEVPLASSGVLTDRIQAGRSGTALAYHRTADVPRDPVVSVDSEYAQQDAQAADRAIQSGQKDIFDVSVLKSLYTTGDTDSIIDEHVTKLTKAMTDAGDLLFRFYWKGDQFKEIYGPKSLPELEGNLKKMFEILGDVVLFLKRNRLNKADYEQMEPLNMEDNNK